MKDSLRKQWVAALRSGKYKQGEGKLRKLAVDPETCEPTGEQQFCCLGVLCDLVEPNQWKKADSSDEEWANGRGLDEDGDECTNMPRKALQKKLGLDRPVTRSGPTDETIAGKLAEMNDDGKSFAEIANWIERRKI